MRVGVTLGDEKGLEGQVCAHFGQCSHFLIAEIKDRKIASSQVVKNNAVHGGGGCVAVDEILKYKITHVVSGGMGMGAQQKFANAGVKVSGYSGKVKDGVEKLVKNELGGLDACRDHDECK